MTDLEQLLTKPLARIKDAGFSHAVVKKIIADEFKKKLIMASFYTLLSILFIMLIPLGDWFSQLGQILSQLANSSSAELSSVASNSANATSVSYGALKTQVSTIASDINILIAFLVVGFIGFLITAES